MTSTTPETATQTWAIDATHSVVEVAAKHMMITSVKGRFDIADGSITVDETDADRSSVEVEIAAGSIDTRLDQRDQHLRSPDFLDAAQFPVITFRSRRVQGAWREEGDRFTVVGDLTIRGVTREVKLDATFEGQGKDPWGGERVSFSADTRIDRRDFGLTWNQALEAGGLLVGNDLRVHLDVEAVKA